MGCGSWCEMSRYIIFLDVEDQTLLDVVRSVNLQVLKLLGYIYEPKSNSLDKNKCCAEVVNNNNKLQNLCIY